MSYCDSKDLNEKKAVPSTMEGRRNVVSLISVRNPLQVGFDEDFVISWLSSDTICLSLCCTVKLFYLFSEGGRVGVG